MSEHAYQSDELALEEWERAAARDDLRRLKAAGAAPMSAAELIAVVHKKGRIDGILECARLLSLEDYSRVAEVYAAARIPDRPARRTRR